MEKRYQTLEKLEDRTMKRLFLALLAAAALPLAAAELEIGPEGIAVTPQDPAANWKKAALVPYMTLGPEGKPMALAFRNGQAETPELTWRVTAKKRHALTEISSEIENKTQKELWIEPELRLVFDGGTFLRFWDGFNVVKEAGAAPLLRRTTKSKFEKNVGASMMPFPVSAVFGKKSAVFLGGALFDPISFSASGFYPEARQLAFSFRFVLAPGKSVAFRMFLGESGTRYGEREGVVQKFYDSLPELWATDQENPYIWGAYTHYQSWWAKPDAELLRRRYATIEWCYCPYRRSGDIYGYDELSDYKMFSKPRNVPKLGGVMVDAGKMTNADYRKLRKERFDRFGRKFGWMFYNSCCGLWCEITLAQKRFPDSINDDPDVPRILTTWSTAYDKEIRTFPYGTGYQKFYEDSVRDTAKEVDPPGFAFDCGYGGAFYRGPAVGKDIPGRAWDEKGKFIEQALAVNRQVDLVRSLKGRDGRPLTAWVNGYLKADRNELEAGFRNHGRFMRNMPLWRYWVGPKPASISSHFMFTLLFPDWRTKTPEELTEALAKVADYTMLSAFKYGMFYDFVQTNGNPVLLYVMPELEECIRTGWQATVPLTTVPAGLRIPFRSRYGRGVQTIFYLGNSAPKPVSGTLRFDNAQLDGKRAVYLFLRHLREDSSTVNKVEQGETCVDAELPSRTPVLFRAVAGVDCPAGTLVTVSAQRQLHKRVITLDFKGKAFTSPLEVRELRAFRPAEVTLDGKKADPKAPLAFRDGSRLVLTYKSLEFRSPASAIASFFVGAKVRKQAEFTVCAPEEARSQAERFVTYFEFLKDKKVFGKNSAVPQVVITSKPKFEKGKILLFCREKQVSGAGRQSGALAVWAASPEALDRNITALFRVMDKTFVYDPPFVQTMGLPREPLLYTKLYGKCLPYRKFWGEYK